MNSSSRMGTWSRQVQDTAREMYDEFCTKVKSKTPFDELPQAAKDGWYVAADKRLREKAHANAS